MSSRQNTRAPQRALGVRQVQSRLMGPKRYLIAASSLRRFGLPSHPHRAMGARRAPERRSGEAQGPGNFHCPEWQLRPSDKSERSRGAAGAETIPPATRSSSQGLRAGFTVPLPPENQGDVGTGEWVPSRIPDGSRKPLSSPGHQVNIRRNQAGEGRGGAAGGGRNRPVDEDLVVPHPGDEVLSLLLGQGPLVVSEQLASIAEDQQLHSVPPAAGTARPGLLLRAAFPLGFGAASGRAVHDSVPGVQAGSLLRRDDVPDVSAWPTPSVRRAASRPQPLHRRHSGQQNGGSATSGEGRPYFRRAGSADSLPPGQFEPLEKIWL